MTTTGQGPAFWEVWREAGHSHQAVARRAADAKSAPSVGELRNSVLREMGMWPEGEAVGDPTKLALLDQFEAALREVWEREVRLEVEGRARNAIRRSLEALADGKLL